jgi:hypothetical protein
LPGVVTLLETSDYFYEGILSSSVAIGGEEFLYSIASASEDLNDILWDSFSSQDFLKVVVN